ncbi:hypothetical protein [Streptomyces sp. NPDC006307]|uniref:hypothetical protein n=1 Tax=Streptomyces sp. NPDC006307 TaxID=3156748 RepID=UPI0033BA6D75
MTDLADTPAASSPADPSNLSPRDEARVALAIDLCNLSSRAMQSVPVDPEASPGALLRAALDLQRLLNNVVVSAVIAERERGTTWDQIGMAASMTRQSAHEKWTSDVKTWAELGRTARSSNSSYATTLEYATLADRQYAATDPSRPQAVTSGLDAVRFPGSQAYEDNLRTRGAALHAQLRKLRATVKDVDERHTALEEGGRDNDGLLSENLLKHAAAYDEMADIYEQLVAAEPALADEHRSEAEYRRSVAQKDRNYVELLQERQR